MTTPQNVYEDYILTQMSKELLLWTKIILTGYHLSLAFVHN